MVIKSMWIAKFELASGNLFNLNILLIFFLKCRIHGQLQSLLRRMVTLLFTYEAISEERKVRNFEMQT